MYPAVHAASSPDKPAYILARSGQTITYRELNDRSNQLAQLFQARGLKFGEAVAICMENNADYLVCTWAAQRSGLYYTAMSSRLTTEEVEYILNDCGAQVFITSREWRPTSATAPPTCTAG
jgi:long-chain acyl-CoA synthetase